ncbi:SDR family oxidoreductase [Anaerolineales bacterium HSG24]|nr:SDR family oxidoreductase [Anaerolineales bacterium HSG24]
MNKHILSGKLALVTGASSGLGVDFARGLAEFGCNLVLVARRENRLQKVKESLINDYGVEVTVIPMDLVQREAPQRLYDQLTEMDKTVDVLINNAGFGLHGEFVDIPWEKEGNMLDLDIVTLTHLTKLFVKDMVAQNFGFIMQVSSIGAYQPSPTYATYSAAKSYVLYFGEALNYELRNVNVSCTVVSPGITATEFLQVSGQKPTLYQRIMMMKSADVTQIGLKAMLKRRSSVVPGWLNAFIAFLTRFMPRRVSAMLGYKLMTMQ